MARRTGGGGDVFDLPVHPLAAIFPLMADDELNELAEDIAQNGLIHSVVIGEWVDDDGEVIEGVVDGRNRLAACRIAGIEPTTQRLNGEDPRAFIVSANLARRNLTKGQQAMLYVVVYPKPQQGRRSDLLGDLTGGLSRERISLARAVYHGAPDLVNAVIAGPMTLDVAYNKARERQTAASSEHAQMEQLRAQAPDIAELVVEERISLAAGLKELEEREKKVADLLDRARKSADRLVGMTTSDILNVISAIEYGERSLVSAEQLQTVVDSINLLTAKLREAENDDDQSV